MPGLRVCRHFFDDEGIDATDRRSCSSDLNPEVRFVQELTDALTQVWEELTTSHQENAQMFVGALLGT